jgi:hypothetical protein
MINGAFGIGKTTVANSLITQLPNSMLYDPEEVGQMLRKITQGYRLPHEDTDDFQDIDLWPSITIEVAERLISKYQRTLIIPMTLANEDYFLHIKNGLYNVASSLHHFCLTASVETIHQRLAQRGDVPGSWPFQQTIRCTEEHRKPIYAEKINSEDLSAAQIQDYILDRV